jgi:2-polyprenyl-3-methyl-5-hydroxy-6-metoxy-1,4-benzoquinol methylase
MTGEDDASVGSNAPATFVPVAGEVYERQLGRWSRRIAPLFLNFLGDAGEAKRIIDVGCGTGSLTSSLAERHPTATIVGCDIAEPLLAYARTANRHPERVTFEHADACALPYDEGAFDCALCNFVLMFVPDADLAAREMARVARPGGVVAATTWDFRGGFTYIRMIADTMTAMDAPEAEAWRARFFSAPGARPGALAALWHGAGLRNVREAEITVRVEYANFADLWDPISSGPAFGVLIRSWSPEWQARVREKVRAAYLAGDPDGPRSFAITAWAVAGTR